jgi:hypothetical protein
VQAAEKSKQLTPFEDYFLQTKSSIEPTVKNCLVFTAGWQIRPVFM